MGIYYKCLCGDNEHLGIFEPEAFVVEDATGRRWICFPIPARKVENLSLLAHVTDVHETDARSKAQGLAEKGTDVRIIYCETADELLAKLKSP